MTGRFKELRERVEVLVLFVRNPGLVREVREFFDTPEIRDLYSQMEKELGSKNLYSARERARNLLFRINRFVYGSNTYPTAARVSLVNSCVAREMPALYDVPFFNC